MSGIQLSKSLKGQTFYCEAKYSSKLDESIILRISVSYSDFGVDPGHHSCEFLEVNGSVSILVSKLNHLIHFRAGEVLSN